MEITEDREYLSTREVARIYGFTRQALLLWEKKGYIHPLRTPGGQRRYKRSEIEGIMRRKANEKTAT